MKVEKYMWTNGDGKETSRKFLVQKLILDSYLLTIMPQVKSYKIFT